jgi:hypothetical protein
VATDRQREFRFDGGATWLNLLGTRGQSFGPHPIERLATPARLADWLARCDLSPVEPPTAEDLDRARSLRQALRVLALAVVDGVAGDVVDGIGVDGVGVGVGAGVDGVDGVGAGVELVAAVRECADGDPGPVRLAGGWPPRRLPPRDTAEALARIARQALEQLTGPERHQLVSCAEHDCRWVFLDPTGRRRWCPSPSCASRGRVRALRARRKSATSET